MLVADDHPIYREGIVRAIKERPDLELIGEAIDGRDALEQIKAVSPAVAVLDIRMPGLDGTQVLAAMRRDGLDTEVLFVSAFMEPGSSPTEPWLRVPGAISRRNPRARRCARRS